MIRFVCQFCEIISNKNNKMNLRLILLFLVVHLSGFAQNARKQLSLDDAVLMQRGALIPSNLQGLQWIPGTANRYSFLRDGNQLVIKKANDSNEKILGLDEFNSKTKNQFKRFPSIKWLDANKFYFKSGNIYCSYQIIDFTIQNLLRHPELAENLDYQERNNLLAFTMGNNLYISTAKDSALPVTQHKANSKIVAGQSIARNEFGINKGTFWSPQGKHLAFYQKNESEVSNYPLLDINTTPGALRMIPYPMAGQKSEMASIGIYDVAKRKTVYLKIEGEKDQYLTNLSWHPDGNYIFVAHLNRDQNHLQLKMYDVKTGKLEKLLLEEKNNHYVEPEHGPYFLPNGKEFYWMSERDGFNHLYKYDLSGNLMGQITSGNWIVDEILGFDSDMKYLTVAGIDETGLNRNVVRIRLDNLEKQELSRQDGVYNYILDPRGDLLIENGSSLELPRRITILSVKEPEFYELIWEAKNPLLDYETSTTELIDLKAADGTILHSRLIKPSHFNPQTKYPVLVYVYGGPHAQMISNSWLAAAPLWMHYMAEKGYLVYTLDNRGSKNRGLAFEQVIHRQLGTVELQDQMVGVDFLKSLPYVDTSKMAVHGWSFGGFMTISMMLKTPDIFKVGVAGGPVTDWKYYEVMYGERYMDRPEQNQEGYEKASLIPYVKNLKGNLMLIHGSSDDVVLEQHSLTLNRAFIENKKQTDYFTYPMHGHNVLGLDRVHLMQKVLLYIEDKLYPNGK